VFYPAAPLLKGYDMLDGYKRMIAAGVGFLILGGQNMGWIPMDADTAQIIAAIDFLVVLGLSIYEKVRTK